MEEGLGRSPPQMVEFSGKATFFIDLTVKALYNIWVGCL